MLLRSSSLPAFPSATCRSALRSSGWRLFGATDERRYSSFGRGEGSPPGAGATDANSRYIPPHRRLRRSDTVPSRSQSDHMIELRSNTV